MTVLVLAADRDPTADRVIRTLYERDVPHVRFDTARFPLEAAIDAELRQGRWTGRLRTNGKIVALEELRSIWYRSPGAFEFPGTLSATERQWATTESKLGLGGVLAALPVCWVNHPARNADAAYKPVQLVTAARCGLQVADTLVTNEPEAVRRFACGGEVVTKAFGSPSIREEGVRKVTFTALVTESDLADLRGIEVSAHQFQRWVPKLCEARVIVVGDRLFAAAIHARTEETRVDWRNDYSALRYERIEPPAQVTNGVRGYCAALGLVYGAFDFVIRPDGAWVFLECNAGGQYGWIEDEIEAPISEAIADVLEAG
ncbi:ATP-grasp ribosomal peptide maturase [Lentzea albidocapillata]|uniref:ATP-grasp ribosomal peptide maturase, SAV_5884 family n=1 Tax=Lentzea albidocapillata TaxID=40571 RepID=A0A1W2FMM1_9PSEU|nr:ATP-grasp ribosomal peptide maturase [Lentzea albidocapillata]SMD23133.1 ATP-grasp ribosomal peptide maturase, SAV_5884 family [Lentzea albidocapillata]